MRTLFCPTAVTIALALTLAAPFAMAQGEPKTAEAAKAPHLTLTEPIKDLGTIPKGQKLNWSFEVKNTGTSDLKILDAKPLCGCTVADFTHVIKPGESGMVTAHVDTTSFAGPISKVVQLQTNDPSAVTAQVTIKAIVNSYVEAHPAGFVRFNLLQGEAEKQSILLYSEETEPFEIVNIESPQKWIKAEAVKAVGEDARPMLGREGQTQYRIEITVGVDKTPVGFLAEKIHVMTNSKHQPDYWLNISGVVGRPSNTVSDAPASAQAEGDESDKPLSADAIAKLTSGGSSDDQTGDIESGNAHKKKQQNALTNEDIVAMVKAELGDQVVIDKIKSSPGDNLDTSTDALIRLKEAGVSKAVIDAMIKRGDQ
jgi:hypothetical protein